MSSKTVHENNYLTAQNGCTIVSSSSQHPNGAASNILLPLERALWLTEDNLPQQCIISLKNMIKKPTSFNLIGFYCWHQYDSNPALIQVMVRSNSERTERWNLLSKIRLSYSDGWQYFKTDEITPQKIKELKLRIIQNFGAPKTYLNQVSLHSIQSSASRDHSLDHEKKTVPSNPPHAPYSEFIKLTSTQRELKKANDKIQKLTEEQEEMKSKICSQQKIIIEMQQTLKRVLATVEKMQSIDGDHHHHRKKSPYSSSKRKELESKKKNMSDSERKARVNEQLDEVLEKFEKVDREFKKKKGDANKRATTHAFQEKQKQRDIIKLNSEDDLSQFSHSHYKTSISHKKKTQDDVERMREKLKHLKMLRNMKQSELQKTGSKGGVSRNSQERAQRQDKGRFIRKVCINEDYQNSDDDSECYDEECPVHGRRFY